MTDMDAGYNARRALLLRELYKGEATCAYLASVLGWSSREVAGKLQSLKTGRLVRYDGDGYWRAIRRG